MAYEIANYSVKITLVAAADLSSGQYKFVKLDNTGKAVLCSGATDKPIGVLQNAPISGQEAEVLVAGGTKVVAGGTVSIGNVVGTGASATGVALTVSTDATKYVVGTALSGAASGEVFTAVIDCAAAGRAA
jgi:hypothetical protein